MTRLLRSGAPTLTYLAAACAVLAWLIVFVASQWWAWSLSLALLGLAFTLGGVGLGLAALVIWARGPRKPWLLGAALAGVLTNIATGWLYADLALFMLRCAVHSACL